jgi:hypothetical protein
VKLYKEEGGGQKGDASVGYLTAASVQLAIDMLDNSQITPGHVIRVKRVCRDEGGCLRMRGGV